MKVPATYVSFNRKNAHILASAFQQEVSIWDMRKVSATNFRGIPTAPACVLPLPYVLGKPCSANDVLCALFHDMMHVLMGNIVRRPNSTNSAQAHSECVLFHSFSYICTGGKACPSVPCLSQGCSHKCRLELRKVWQSARQLGS